MLHARLDNRVQDTIARNSIATGRYILVSFPDSDLNPLVLARGMDERRTNLAIHACRDHLTTLRKGVSP